MALRLFRAEHHYLRVQVDGDAATLMAISKDGEVLERVLLHEPVVPDADYGPPLPTMAAARNPPAVGSPQVVRKPTATPAASRFRPSLPQFLLVLSSMAMIVGLLLLTAPRARRRDDLMPHAKRRWRRHT